MLGFEIGNNGLKVRVNSIAPGVFPSEMTQGESGENQKSELPKEDFEGKVFAQRPGNDRDMANMMITVATNQYLNGQAIAVCQVWCCYYREIMLITSYFRLTEVISCSTALHRV